jgi:phosphate transport system permease protein
MTAPIEALRSSIKRRQLFSNAFSVLGLFVIAISALILLALVLRLGMNGLPRLLPIAWVKLFGLLPIPLPRFFTLFPSSTPEDAGILTALVGTSLIMLVTALTAVPLGVAAGIYLEEYAQKNWLSGLVEINVTNLAGVPSIVYGLLALGLFSQQLKLGDSIATAGLTLALLILPVVIVTTREALRAIPTHLREAAYAVGATRWQMIWDHILPYSAGSILTGIIIGLSRAIGETAPLITIGALTFIAFLPDPPLKPEFPFISFDWLKSEFTVMPIQMFNWVSRPEPEFQANAAATGVVLVLMTLLMNGLAIYLRYRLRRGIKW